MEENEARARDREVASRDETAETTPDTTLETSTESLTAPLPAEQRATAALPAPPHIADPVTTLSAPPLEEVLYAAEAVPPAAAPSLPAPAQDAHADAESVRPRGPRMRTIVLGLVLLAVSGTGLVRLLTGVRIDDTLVLLTLLVVAGALLLGGGVASAAREARSGRRRG